jgi:vancomycin resistance protein YoaR
VGNQRVSHSRVGNKPLINIERAIVALLIGFCLYFFIVVSIIIGYQVKFAGRMYPGVHISNYDLTDLNRPEAAELLTKNIDYTRSGEGRSSWPWTNLSDQYKALTQGVFLPQQFIFDGRMAQLKVDRISAEVNRPTIEASLEVDGFDVYSHLGQVGRSLDVWMTTAILEGQLRTFENGEIPLKVIETPPHILDPSAQAELAREIISQPLELKIPGEEDGLGPWIIDREGLSNMLSIVRIRQDDRENFSVGLNTESLSAYLIDIAPSLLLEPGNAKFIFNDDTSQLDLIDGAVIGRRLNIEGSVDNINQQLMAGKHDIDLVFDYSDPPITDDVRGEDIGITELVSAHTTYFYGSSSGRIQNIQTAAARFHGLFVPPGATFSMVEHLGDISLDSGYTESLIIYGNRTIKGVGGGVCQVSTTLFRTVFFGGFPVVERHPHAYRVYYYEQKRGGGVNDNLAGLDATVYAPIVDFKCTNDTSHLLLMETYVNPSARTITWKFYSTSDGRTVEWNTGGLQNIIDSPETIYEENPELKKGEVRQVDWAVDGADVSISRVVYRGDTIVHSDIFNTHYLPWAEVWQYGPGTEGYPPEKPESETNE